MEAEGARGETIAYSLEAGEEEAEDHREHGFSPSLPSRASIGSAADRRRRDFPQIKYSTVFGVCRTDGWF